MMDGKKEEEALAEKVAGVAPELMVRINTLVESGALPYYAPVMVSHILNTLCAFVFEEHEKISPVQLLALIACGDLMYADAKNTHGVDTLARNLVRGYTATAKGLTDGLALEEKKN